MNRPDFICTQPYTNLELLPTGAVACCGAFFTEQFHIRARNAGTDYKALWNGPEYLDLRRSVSDGSYRHCTDRCPEYLAIRDQKSEKMRVENVSPEIRNCASSGDMRLTVGPRVVALSNDMSCNLKCRSCRADFIRDSNAVHDARYEKTVAMLEEMGNDIVTLAFSSSGEPFFSRYYLRLLREYICREKLPKVHLHLGTNGTLLNQAMWDSIKDPALIHLLCISIDAATPETYKIVRGFDWDRLMSNLAFLKTKRDAGKIPHFQLRMVVQALNWREMEAFFTLAKSFSADPVYQLVYPWGTLTDADMIYYPNHPDYQAFMEHLRAFDARHPKLEAYYRQLL